MLMIDPPLGFTPHHIFVHRSNQKHRLGRVCIPLENNRQSVGCLGEGMGLTSSPPNLLYCLVSCCFKVYCHILCYNTLICCASARCSGQTALQSSGHCPCNSYCAAQSLLQDRAGHSIDQLLLHCFHCTLHPMISKSLTQCIQHQVWFSCDCFNGP